MKNGKFRPTFIDRVRGTSHIYVKRCRKMPKCSLNFLDLHYNGINGKTVNFKRAFLANSKDSHSRTLVDSTYKGRK